MKVKNTGHLFLLPSTLGDCEPAGVLPGLFFEIIDRLTLYIVENERTARRFLIKAGLQKPIDELTFFILNKHTDDSEISHFMEPLQKGKDVGILSEAGLPGVADPGSKIVQLAHKSGIKVVPVSGPSSVFLSLMASGMNGQNFAFYGYLPIQKQDRTRKIKLLETRSKKENQTQIFIETPYRNNHLLSDLANVCQPGTQICVATDLSLADESIQTKTAGAWKKNLPDLHKKPSIFLLHAYG